jgi:glycine C-acetyltransferase
MSDLEEQLKEASSSRRKLIVTDGSFQWTIAQLDKICDLADKYMHSNDRRMSLVL